MDMQGSTGMHHPAGTGTAQNRTNMRHSMAGMQGHGAQMDMPGMGMHMHGDFKKRFWVSLILAVPILLLSPAMGVVLPFQPSFPGSEWVVMALATLLYLYGGMPFLKGAVGELKERRPAMMTLISLGITAAYIYSLYVFVRNLAAGDTGDSMDFFWELATLIVVMLLGHWIEMRAVMGAGDALQKIAALLPGEATVVEESGALKNVPLTQLQVGQTVLVRDGGKVPADGRVLEGTSHVDESMVTGESRGVAKKPGDRVIGGSQNTTGALKVQVTATGESGYLAQVQALVGSAQGDKSRVETLSDRVAGWLFYVAVAVSVIALTVWLLVTHDFNTALLRAVTVLVIACPHALGLAVPLVTARSTSLGAKNGLLVRNRQALETATRVDLVTMDKTGTLTEGHFTLADVESFSEEYTREDILQMAAALERGSGHPLAQGILEAVKKGGLPPAAARNVQVLTGQGVTGRLQNGKEALLVSDATLDSKHIPYNKAKLAEYAGRGLSVSFLVVDGKAVGILAEGDEIKPDARHFVDELREENIEPVMLTGDNRDAAKKTAAVLGLEDYRAGLLPGGKEDIVKQYKGEGCTVMMVGDGVNDAPALARADVGVAVGAGTDVAIDSADVVLVRSEPGDILHFFSLAKATLRKMKQNLWWGAGYNIIAIPLAAGVLAPIGITLSPAVGALLMSLSTVIVAVNALTLHVNYTDNTK